jgi:hypothetical protein
MRKRPVAALALACVLGSLAAASACREPTHILLELTTDVSCEQRLTTAVVVGTLADTAKSLDERPATTATTACAARGGGDAFIGTLAITPSESDTGEVAIKVVAGIGVPPEQCTDPRDKRCIIARRVRKFEPHARVALPIALNDACRGVPCGVDETCSRGSCVSVRCEELGTCLPSPRDAGGDGAEAGPADAGDAQIEDARAPTDAGTPADYALALGRTFTCALRRRDSAVFCWGDNHQGQVPGSTPLVQPTPAQVSLPAGRRISQLVAADDRALVLFNDGEVWGWGEGNSGSLGATFGPVPPMPLWSGVAAVAAGRYTTCLKLTSGVIECHGAKADKAKYTGGFDEHCTGANFLLGRSVSGRVVGARWEPDAPTPTGDAGFALDGAADLGLTATSVHCGDSFVLVRAADGGVAGWGNNSPYVLTDDVDAGLHGKVNLPSLGGFTTLAVGIDHACGIREGAVSCWGSGEFGAVDGTIGLNRPKPAAVTFDLGHERTAVAVYPGATHSCAVHSDGSVWCWGSNDQSQVGQSASEAGVGAPPTRVNNLPP